MQLYNEITTSILYYVQVLEKIDHKVAKGFRSLSCRARSA